jgi:hypothetical protein
MNDSEKLFIIEPVQQGLVLMEMVAVNLFALFWAVGLTFMNVQSNLSREINLDFQRKEKGVRLLLRGAL